MGTSYAEEIISKPRVYDGDTLEIAGQLIRLAGADAPPADTLCGLPGNLLHCGQEASFALAYTVAEHWVTCTPQGQNADGTVFAQCKVGPYGLAERVITQGWAMAVSRIMIFAELFKV
jgi:endonuclease YncB( thermonuclease family)